jgi:hypothetical protein
MLQAHRLPLVNHFSERRKKDHRAIVQSVPVTTFDGHGKIRKKSGH